MIHDPPGFGRAGFAPGKAHLEHYPFPAERGMECTATREGGYWVINGTKHFVSGADPAQAFRHQERRASRPGLRGDLAPHQAGRACACRFARASERAKKT
ncbi:hypothetical protein [Limimaricola litoreus]|uniref:hypothetical protein n=1 Tax=Limimaricola litoreus TaxID=2955316 RepID=UPI0020A21539|nr:hypothetical protein [Limimaricola litoreus]